ncbi:hypothetical protein SAMN04488121_1011335 [Chitinophaga filiformis]|uniref:Uncharacterized protein n=1 Tax=Chitinophaga filiformis TaxID=104663 RepID=A0A1G7JQM4_CHIFI|nr:hypothetical protein SAMN04488121_1011335 [Chitinophaga filiformis]
MEYFTTSARAFNTTAFMLFKLVLIESNTTHKSVLLRPQYA